MLTEPWAVFTASKFDFYQRLAGLAAGLCIRPPPNWCLATIQPLRNPLQPVNPIDNVDMSPQRNLQNNSSDNVIRRSVTQTKAVTAIPDEFFRSKSSSLPPSRTQCPVCRKTWCRLLSHRRYARDNADRKKANFARSQELMKRSGAPIHQISNAVTDPFGEFPVKMTSELNHIYRYCKSSLQVNFLDTRSYLLQTQLQSFGIQVTNGCGPK